MIAPLRTWFKSRFRKPSPFRNAVRAAYRLVSGFHVRAWRKSRLLRAEGPRILEEALGKARAAGFRRPRPHGRRGGAAPQHPGRRAVPDRAGRPRGRL